MFNTVLYRGVCRPTDTVSTVIVKLGEAAGIKVDEDDKKAVYASSHDFRRAFGFRWANRVMPMALKVLVRHASVTTSEKYYVDINAQETARFLRNVTLDVTPKKNESQPVAETRENA